MTTPTPIRANSILPARREEIELRTADALTLVGELALPADPHATVNATLVCLHPLPTHGGMMDSHILRKAAWRLPAQAGVAVLRFNTRGTSSVRGTSEGEFTGGDLEGHDVAAAVAYAHRRGLPSIWLLGWSFGAELALRFGAAPPVEEAIAGAVVLSPPFKRTTPEDLDRWAATGKPLTAIVPELDDYLRPDEARAALTRVPQAEVLGVAGARHLWVGMAELVLDEIVRRVVPAAYPLARHWIGSVEQGDASAYADRTVAALRARRATGEPDHPVA